MNIAPTTVADGPFRPARNPWGIVLALVPAALLACLSGCSVVSGAPPDGHILVVDQSGAPLQGAVIYPENEDSSATPGYFPGELRERTSGAQGTIIVHLEDFLWASDACYHFLISRPGFEDENMTVSRDLFPQVLRVDMRAKVAASPPPASPGRQGTPHP
jgi:hypothetical protein